MSEELNGKLNDCHEMVRQLEALKSRTNEEMKEYESELVRLDNAELLEDVDSGLKQARRAIADLERLIDATNDVIEKDEEKFATIADFEKSNKVAKHAPKDDDSDLDNNHIIPAGVDVVVEPKKQDKKKSSAAKVDEELDILDDEVKEIEFNLNDHIARIKRLEEIKSTLKKQKQDKKDHIARVKRLEEIKSTLKKRKQDKKKSSAAKVDEELVILEEPAAKVDEELFIADLERVIDETNDIIEEKEEFATIAKVEKSNKVAKHAPKDDGSDVDNNHIIPAGVDVVARQKKQDEKKSSAAKLDEEMDKLDEEMDILDEEVKEIEVKLKDHYERINRLERIKSTLMDTVDVERYWQADTEQMQLRVGLRAVLKKPRDVERYVQADAEQIQLKLSVQAIQEIVEKKKEELEVIWKRMKELEQMKSDLAETI